MRRVHLAGWMVAITFGMAALLLLTARKAPAPAEVPVAEVGRGSIRQVAALSGRIAWRDEHLVYARAPGMVEEVLAQPGKRLAAGDALLRLASGGVDRLASTWTAADEALHQHITGADMAALQEALVIRAPVDGTLRQLLTQESAMVAAGAPVAVLSSGEQVVICQALEADAEGVRPGMQAQLYRNGEPLGGAEVLEAGPVSADPATGLLTCTVILAPEGRLTLPAGTAVEVDIGVFCRENVTVLPLEAITARDTVWWICDERCTEIPAEIVMSDEMNAWVRLPEGMRVALGELQEGQRVTEVQP